MLVLRPGILGISELLTTLNILALAVRDSELAGSSKSSDLISAGTAVQCFFQKSSELLRRAFKLEFLLLFMLHQKKKGDKTNI
jgi:hypothetical protein